MFHIKQSFTLVVNILRRSWYFTVRILHMGRVAVVVRVDSSVQAIPFTVVERGPRGLVIVYHERECLVVDQGTCRVQGNPLWVAAVVDLSRLGWSVTICVEIGLWSFVIIVHYKQAAAVLLRSCLDETKIRMIPNKLCNELWVQLFVWFSHDNSLSVSCCD